MSSPVNSSPKKESSQTGVENVILSNNSPTSPVVTISFPEEVDQDEQEGLNLMSNEFSTSVNRIDVIDKLGFSTMLQVQSPADVCRICHCGPNTLATPTPQILTPICSPKKLNPHEASSSRNLNPNAVSLQLKQALPQQQQPVGKSPVVVLQNQIVLSPDYNLISPCVCSGSLKYVHQCCLQHWIRASNNTSCELCKHPYELRSTFKPLWKWESLPMSPGEKKRVVCSALFHTVALACVIWSLYVLIDRTVEELTHSDLEWQFWTKIIVEAIGCLGAGILTYVWGKSYVSMLIKWVTFNRSFVILGKANRNSLSGPPIIGNYEPEQHSFFPATSSSTSTTQQQNCQQVTTEQELIQLIKNH